jgi:nucleoside-diphosphate-sugar epimerase
MKLFVTGGTGFIGSHFLREAARRRHQIVALRRRPAPAHALPLASIDWVDGDLESCPRQALAGCGALVHFAAHGVLSPSPDWQDCFHSNVYGTLALLLSARDAGVRRFVICGSCSEYGRAAEQFAAVPSSAPLLPIGAYGTSKAAATMAAIGVAQQHEIELIILRPFHIYGEGEAPTRFWPSLRRAAQAGEDFPMTPGEQIRDFTPVNRVAEAFADSLMRSDLLAGQPLIENVGTGVATTLHDFARYWWQAWEARGELLPGAVPYRENEVMRYVPELPTRSGA